MKPVDQRTTKPPGIRDSHRALVAGLAAGVRAKLGMRGGGAIFRPIYPPPPVRAKRASCNAAMRAARSSPLSSTSGDGHPIRRRHATACAIGAPCPPGALPHPGGGVFRILVLDGGTRAHRP